jgi:hypothetical protein
MSIEISSNPITLQPIATTIKVRMTDGQIMTVVRRATYQVDPVSGHSCAVKGSIGFEDVRGNPINENLLVGFSDEVVAPVRTYFWSENGNPIYVENGIAYSLDGGIYSGPLEGYQPGYPVSHHAANIKTVWAVYGKSYLQLNAFTYNNITTYQTINGTAWSGTAPIVLELPAPVFGHINKYIDSVSNTIDAVIAALESAPGPLAGWAIAWVCPFPTTCEPMADASQIFLDNEPLVGNSGRINQGCNGMETVQPPNLEIKGKAAANIVWHYRVSPVVIQDSPEMNTGIEVSGIAV